MIGTLPLYTFSLVGFLLFSDSGKTQQLCLLFRSIQRLLSWLKISPACREVIFKNVLFSERSRNHE